MTWTHKHHVIPKHEWKQRFDSLDGFNSPDNIVYLTVEQHAQAHEWLYEQYHREYDRLAWNGLLGRIPKEDIIRLKRLAQSPPVPKGSRMSESWKRNISIASMGKRGTRLGVKCSPETIEKRKQSLRALPKLQCPHCSVNGAYCSMKKNHFKNCKVFKSPMSTRNT